MVDVAEAVYFGFRSGGSEDESYFTLRLGFDRLFGLNFEACRLLAVIAKQFQENTTTGYVFE